MKATHIRFFRTKLRLAEKAFLREQEEFDRLRFWIEKDVEGYEDEEIEEMWNNENLRSIEETGNSLN